jgi:hypothetical protein
VVAVALALVTSGCDDAEYDPLSRSETSGRPVRPEFVNCAVTITPGDVDYILSENALTLFTLEGERLLEREGDGDGVFDLWRDSMKKHFGDVTMTTWFNILPTELSFIGECAWPEGKVSVTASSPVVVTDQTITILYGDTKAEWRNRS